MIPEDLVTRCVLAMFGAFASLAVAADFVGRTLAAEISDGMLATFGITAFFAVVGFFGWTFKLLLDMKEGQDRQGVEVANLKEQRKEDEMRIRDLERRVGHG